MRKPLGCYTKQLFLSWWLFGNGAAWVTRTPDPRIHTNYGFRHRPYGRLWSGLSLHPSLNKP